MSGRDLREDARRAGLCGLCEHVRRVGSTSRSVFYMCGRALEDGRYAKYPSLPVHVCVGFEPVASPAPDQPAPDSSSRRRA